MKSTINLLMGILLALFIGHTVINTTDSSQKPIIDSQHVKIVTVAHGDTLWSIASKLTPNELDIRDVIYTMKSINKLESSKLHPGMQIKVPTIKNDKKHLPNEYDIAQK